MAEQLDLLNTLLQAYQGQALTAGPYFNLAQLFQPAYGQLGLTNEQQQLFGYNVGPSGGIGTPATPLGGFFGSPQAGTSGPVYGPSQPGGTTGATVPGIDPGAFNPFIGNSTTSSVPGNYPIYSPDQGTRIGNGNEFNDPYSGLVGPGQTAGYHPGVLDLNTTALSSFGPLATLSLFQSNPYLMDALNQQGAGAAGALNLAQGAGASPLLNTLNQQAQGQLDLNGALSPEAARASDQSALGLLSNAGLQNTNSGIAAQLFSRDAATQQRQQQAQQLAALVQGLNTQQLNTQGNLFGIAGGLAGNTAASATSGITNPILQVLGLGSLNATSNPSSTIANQGQLTNPFLQAGLDVAGANFNANIAQDIANQNSDAALTSGLLSAGGSLLGGIFSDERLKTKVKDTGEETDEGVPIKTWVYRTDPKKRRYKGVLAQDLEAVNPYAILTDPISGIKAVDYRKAGTRFELVNPYERMAA